MDMSVTVGAADEKLAQAPTRRLARGANSSDLDAWLEKALKAGDYQKALAAAADDNR